MYKRVESNKLHIHTTLPNTLEELLEVALKHLKEVELNDNLVVDMSQWAQKRRVYSTKGVSEPKCRVCLGGAALLGTTDLEAQLGESYANDGITREAVLYLESEDKPDIKGKLYALDALRQGDIGDAIRYMRELGLCKNVPATMDYDFTPESYSSSPPIWYNAMDEVLRILKQIGA